MVWALMTMGVINTASADPVYDLAQKYFPQADRVEAFEGDPLAAPVYEGDRLLGYVLRTTDIAPIPAYSGEPITLLVGIDLDGWITGVEITEHSEPILDAVISELDLKYFVYQYRDIAVQDRVKLGGSARGVCDDRWHYRCQHYCDGHECNGHEGGEESCRVAWRRVADGRGEDNAADERLQS